MRNTQGYGDPTVLKPAGQFSRRRFWHRKINISIGCFLVLLAVCCGLSGCKPDEPAKEKTQKIAGTPALPLKKLFWGEYPEFDDCLDLKGLNASIDSSLTYLSRVPGDRTYPFGKETVTARHMIRSLKVFQAFIARSPLPEQVNAFIEEKFQVYESVGNPEGQVLFTGYFEPTYEGCLKPDETCPYPLFSLPTDLLKIDLSLFSDEYSGHKALTGRVDGRRVVPYYSREQINLQQGFETKAQPVVWLKNRVDRFFLEVQGSGRVLLPNGKIIRVHYAGSNGNPYRSVGRYLINKGEIPKEEMSMDAIRAFLEKNPDRMDEVLNHNPSFVFFQKEEGGPYGSLGVALTPFRSIATDQRVFPKGALCFVMASLPEKGVYGPRDQWPTASFFAMNQDTGGAIKGPGRADLFCGNGRYAEFTAGNMNNPGRLFFLVLKPKP